MRLLSALAASALLCVAAVSAQANGPTPGEYVCKEMKGTWAPCSGRPPAIQPRHMRVVGWVPVPKAKPGSSRMICCACAGGSCQVGTIQKCSVIATGANCDWVSLTQSCSGTGACEMQAQPSKKSCRANSCAASDACDACSNKATTRERCQPGCGGGLFGVRPQLTGSDQRGIAVCDAHHRAEGLRTVPLKAATR